MEDPKVEDTVTDNTEPKPIDPKVNEVLARMKAKQVGRYLNRHERRKATKLARKNVRVGSHSK